MCYDGALVMPQNYTLVTNDEMTYLEGGYVHTDTGTAKYLKNLASSLMAAWFSLATGWSVSAATAVGSVVGVPLSIIAGIGAAYCVFAGNEYRKAFTYFAVKSQTSSVKYYMKTVSYLGLVTGVVCGKGTG